MKNGFKWMKKEKKMIFWVFEFLFRLTIFSLYTVILSKHGKHTTKKKINLKKRMKKKKLSKDTINNIFKKFCFVFFFYLFSVGYSSIYKYKEWNMAHQFYCHTIKCQKFNFYMFNTQNKSVEKKQNIVWLWILKRNNNFWCSSSPIDGFFLLK